MSGKISKKVNLERQNRNVDRQKAKGMKRLILWVPEKESEEIKLCTRQPHALAKLRKEVEAEVITTLTKKIERQVYTRIAKKVERSILAQRRSQARREEVKKNSPPRALGLLNAHQRRGDRLLRMLDGSMMSLTRFGTYPRIPLVIQNPML